MLSGIQIDVNAVVNGVSVRVDCLKLISGGGLKVSLATQDMVNMGFCKI